MTVQVSETQYQRLKKVKDALSRKLGRRATFAEALASIWRGEA